ncbi:unnamed protein product [Cochlearia groenlandica]
MFTSCIAWLDDSLHYHFPNLVAINLHMLGSLKYISGGYVHFDYIITMHCDRIFNFFPRSLTYSLSQMSYVVSFLIVRYSASAVEHLTVFCFLFFHVTKFPLTKVQ